MKSKIFALVLVMSILGAMDVMAYEHRENVNISGRHVRNGIIEDTYFWQQSNNKRNETVRCPNSIYIINDCWGIHNGKNRIPNYNRH